MLPSLALDGEPSGAVNVFKSGRPCFVADARRAPGLSARLVDALGTASVLFEPVPRGDRVVGVLVVGWARRVGTPAAHAAPLRLLAAEARSVIERSDLLARLASMARTDPLTGLANRRTWTEQLARNHDWAARQKIPLSVALLDLDRFKVYNDAHGHPAGDRLLTDCAASWTRALRTTDLLARLGGDEFGAILPGASLAEARALVERVRAATPGATCSSGVAEWRPGESVEDVVARADRALYQAKGEGRDRSAQAV